MARVIVVGAGVVGSATGEGFGRLGHAVTFVDIDAGRVELMRSRGWAAVDSIDLSGPPAFVFLAVPTPHDGDRYDLGPIEGAASSVGEALRTATSFHTVVVRSTVPPGTCEGLIQPLLEDGSGRRVGDHFGLASNPEFLRAASSVEDFLMPWMTVIGSRSHRTVERLTHLYDGLGGRLRTFQNPAQAEFIKCAHNLFNATKISFWNEMWRVADRLGVPLDDIANTVALSAEGSTNPQYGTKGGMPFGGACLPKDTHGFIGFAEDLGVPVPLLRSVIEVNDEVGEYVQERLAAEALGALDIRGT